MRILPLLLLTPFLVAGPGAADPQQDLARLKEGNDRAISRTKTRRNKVASVQHPFAVVVGCSDSRVAPELVFDQSLGDLFVVRSAGHVLDAPALGSIEYAVHHLGARVVVVLGHERCGAVKASIDGGEASPHIAALMAAIRPAVDEVAGMKGDPLDLAARANVRRVVKQIHTEMPNVHVVGMYYDLDTGLAESLP